MQLEKGASTDNHPREEEKKVERSLLDWLGFSKFVYSAFFWHWNELGKAQRKKKLSLFFASFPGLKGIHFRRTWLVHLICIYHYVCESMYTWMSK